MSGSSLISGHDLDPNLKLPVQNGGLYINSETTEEDKHEARDTLHAIGLAKWLDYRSSEYDMDEVIRSGNHFAFYYTNDNTLGTPYKKGASIYSEALILSFAFSNSFAFQIAYFTGGQSMMRNLQNDVLSDWTPFFLPLDGSVQMGEGLIAQIQSLIDSGVIEVGGFKSPIKTYVGSIGENSITISGKGKLFITGNSYTDNVTLVVDDVTLLNKASFRLMYIQGEYEFTKSISLQGASASSPIKYIAVLY